MLCVALPAMAATGLGTGCDDHDEKPTVIASRSISDQQSLRLRKSDSTADKNPASELGRLVTRSYESTVDPGETRRSAALADALRKRQQRRSALLGDDAAGASRPDVTTELPGVAAADAVVFRREMYRTDI